MPVRTCIFCSRARVPRKRVSQSPGKSTAITLDSPQRMAIPVFHRRISPVLDTCKRMVLFYLESGSEKSSQEIEMSGMPLNGRVRMLADLRVDLVICAGTSQELYNGIKQAGIEMITGIAGEITEVLQGFKEGRLRDPVFSMPGCTPQRGVAEISHHGIPGPGCCSS